MFKATRKGMRIFNQKNRETCIEHSGQVVSITPAQIEVSIVSVSACAACHAKSFCMAFGQEDKNIAVPNTGQGVQVGDKVNVQMKQSLGVRAVVLAYLVPVAVVIVSLLVFIEIGIFEPIAGLLSLAALGIYYVVLYGFRSKLKKVYNFHLVKIE